MKIDLNMNRMLTEAEAKRIYTRYLKKEQTALDIAKDLNIPLDEVLGLVDVLSHYGYLLDVEEIDDDIVITKSRKKNYAIDKKVKPPIEECKKVTLGVVSDTHLCCKDQQLHMLNSAYKYFYEHYITTVLHCGDISDGDFTNKRKLQIYNLFMHGTDEQADYIEEMYPRVNGITTYFIQGNHDETHKINGGGSVGPAIARSRKDMIYCGQDHYDYIDKTTKVKIRMRHPGGGISKYKSRNLQNTIDSMPSGNKPKLLLEGHYHKSYYFIYRNVHAILVPALCCQSAFMEKKDLANIMGFYDIDIYADEKGNVQYITPREHLFDESQVKKDDLRKTKRLVIK